jgi:hypothetical protein
MHKTVILILALAVAVQAQTANPYPLVAHLNSAVFTHTTAPSNTYVSELQIGNIVYIADDVCKAAVVGQDYPAQLEGKRINLLVGKKVCGYRIVGIKEAPKEKQ